MSIIETCSQCGKEFKQQPAQVKREANEAFCSIKCSAASRKNRVKRNCSQCGKEVERRASEVRGEHVFCNRDCYHLHRKGRDVKKGAARRPSRPSAETLAKRLPPVQRVCRACGKTFELPANLANKKGGGRFCSTPCKHKGLSKNVKVQCSICGKDLVRQASRAKKPGKRFYCSKECRSAATKKSRHKVCERCGGPLARPGRKGEPKAAARFCSRECAGLVNQNIRKAHGGRGEEKPFVIGDDFSPATTGAVIYD